MLSSRVSIGAAQFGLNYGISNKDGKVDLNEIDKILQFAKLNEIDTIDTAISYGDSEYRLGKLGMDNWRIVTKLPEVPEHCTDVSGWVDENIRSSLQLLRRDSVFGLLLHRPNQLSKTFGGELWRVIQSLKKNRVVEKVGFSIYDPSELDELIPEFSPDIVQTPYNILDRRIEVSGWLDRMYEMNIEVHVRSVFLQGLLLMDRVNIPRKFERWSSVWNEWEEWQCQHNTTAIQASLSLPMQDPRISRVIVGVSTLSQLKEIVSFSKSNSFNYPKNIFLDDVDLINPSRWSLF